MFNIGRDTSIVNAICEKGDWKSAAYTNWVCDGYKLRIDQDNLYTSRYQLNFKNNKIRNRIRKANQRILI